MITRLLITSLSENPGGQECRPFRGGVRRGQRREQDEDEGLRALPHDLHLRDVRRAEPNPDEGGPQEWARLHQDESQAARVVVRG